MTKPVRNYCPIDVGAIVAAVAAVIDKRGDQLTEHFIFGLGPVLDFYIHIAFVFIFFI